MKRARRITQADYHAAGRGLARDCAEDVVRMCGFNQDCHNGRFNPAWRCDACPHRTKEPGETK